MIAPRLRAVVLGAVLLGLLAALPASRGLGQASSAPSVATHPLLLELSKDLGVEPASQLRMKFEVTFLKIDVADLEARVSPRDAALIEPLVRGADRPKDAYGPIADVLLRSSPVLLTMTYCRDSDFGRFQKGIRSGMEVARKGGAIDENEEARLLGEMEADMAPIQTREVSKNDVLAYRIDGATVRTVYVGVDGQVVVDTTREDPGLAQALLASWFAEESRFRDGLVRSLFP